MKVLIDECIDRYFASEIVGHDVSTVPGKLDGPARKNGELLALAADQYDAFVTQSDQGLSRQQNLSKFDIAVIVLASRSNRTYPIFSASTEPTSRALETSIPGRCVVVSSELET